MKNPLVVPRYNPVEIPSDTFQHKHVCQWSDTDVIGHMNHSHYVRICLDALTSAMLDQKSGTNDAYHKLVRVRDPANARISSLQMLYAAETRPNEELLVHCWTDPNAKENRIHFSVMGQKGPNYFLQLDISP